MKFFVHAVHHLSFDSSSCSHSCSKDFQESKRLLLVHHLNKKHPDPRKECWERSKKPGFWPNLDFLNSFTIKFQAWKNWHLLNQARRPLKCSKCPIFAFLLFKKRRKTPFTAPQPSLPKSSTNGCLAWLLTLASLAAPRVTHRGQGISNWTAGWFGLSGDSFLGLS